MTTRNPQRLQPRQLGQAHRRRPGHAHRGPPARRGQRRRPATSSATRCPPARCGAASRSSCSDRDPRDAWAFTQRICGVCTGTHALTSVRAVEDALGITIPENANTIRNIMQLTLQVHDHLVHFYHLHALDWVDVVSALSADPVATSQLAQSISSWPLSSPGYFRDLQSRLQALRRVGPARTVPQRLLGPPGVQAAAGSQPDGGRALPRGARLPEGDRQDPHDLRRQEPAPELAGRRRAVPDQRRTTPARSARSTWNASTW